MAVSNLEVTIVQTSRELGESRERMATSRSSYDPAPVGRVRVPVAAAA